MERRSGKRSLAVVIFFPLLSVCVIVVRRQRGCTVSGKRAVIEQNVCK